MKIELEISLFNIKDGKLSDTFFDELPWHILSNHFKVKGGASSRSLFSSPDTFVVWKTENYRNQNDYEDWDIDNFFPKKNYRPISR